MKRAILPALFFSRYFSRLHYLHSKLSFLTDPQAEYKQAKEYYQKQ